MSMSGIFEDMVAQRLARFPKGPDGEPLCDVCGAAINPTAPWCGACDERRREEDARAARLADVRFAAKGWAEQLPAWDYARPNCRRWCENVDCRLLAMTTAWDPYAGGLAVCGPTAAGKTSCLVARLRGMAEDAIAKAEAGEVVRLGRLCWTTEAALARDRREWPLGRGTSPIFEEAEAAAVLVVDEVGYARAADILMELADVRYATGRGTMTITTGLTPEQFIERYGSALLRRLTERGQLVDLHDTAATR